MSLFEYLKPPLKAVGTVILAIVTFPYYRLFHFNTLQPIRRIAACASDPAETRRLVRITVLWRTRKVVELQYISIASAVMAAIVTSSFSWSEVYSSYWLAAGLWYCSLLLAILAILVASQQIAVLDILGLPHPTGNVTPPELAAARRKVERFLPLMLTRSRGGDWEVRWKMIFVWQCGVQFLSYSIAAYVLGLTLYVCSPLIQGEWGEQAKSAYIYLGVAAVSGGAFVFCGFWVYHYVDLDSDDGLEEMQTDAQEQDKQSRTGQNLEVAAIKRNWNL